MSEFVTAAGTPLGLYPVVIVQARYGGCYEGAPWVAVPNADMADLENSGFAGSDPDCAEWWAEDDFRQSIGRGYTPDEALKDMVRRYHERGQKE